MKNILFPPKAFVYVKRAKGDKMGSLYTGVTNDYYVENGKFYSAKVLGNPAYNKQFPLRRPKFGVWDQVSVRELK